MARFIAYATKLEGNQLPTPHIVGAFGASAWDIMDFSLDNPHDRIGDIGELIPPTQELVGIQPKQLVILKAGGTTGTKISGANLSKAIKRIEYRYLANAHIMIRILLNEDTIFPNGTTTGDVVVFEARALLAAGNGETTDYLNKKAVYFTINLPVNSTLNYNVNIERFLYGETGIVEFGNDIQVSGGQDNSNIWNVSRSKTHFHGGPVLDPVDGISTGTIFPHYTNLIISDKPDGGGIYVKREFRKLDVIRNPGDTDFYQSGDSVTNIAFDGALDIFKLTDYHSMSGAHNSNWGQEYGGIFFTGPISGLAEYQKSGATPEISVGLDTISDAAFGLGFGIQDIVPAVKDLWYVINNSAKLRNIFWPNWCIPHDPQAKIERNDSHYYINFFQISGDVSFIGNHNLQVSTSLNPNYSFAHAVARTVGVLADQYLTNVGSLGLANVTGIPWLNLNTSQTIVSPLSAVKFGAMSWQEYVAGCVFQTCTPYHGDTGLLDIFNTQGDTLISPLRGFSTSYARTSGLQHVLNAMRGDGINIESGTYPIGEEGLDFVAPNSVILSLYTVFLYVDKPASQDLDQATPIASLGIGTSNTSPFATLPVTQWSVPGVTTTGTSIMLTPRIHFNGSTGDVVDTNNTGYCDRNSSVVYDSESDYKYALASNSCAPTDYNRGNLSMSLDITGESATEGIDIEETELDSIIVLPRSIVFYDDYTNTPSLFFPAVYYNSWYLGVASTSDTINNTNNTVDGNSANVKWITSGNVTYTKTLGGIGLDTDIDEFYTEEYLDVVDVDNVFKFKYIPGKYLFTDNNPGTYFIHDQPEQARSYFTVTPGGVGTDNYDTKPLRQILGFCQEDGVSNDLRKAHSDISFIDDWELIEGRYSVIEQDCDNPISDVDGDAPQIRHRKFIVIGSVEETDVGDPDPPDDVPGCTSTTAINYNPDATIDDGGCIECTVVVDNSDSNIDWIPALSAGFAEPELILKRSRNGFAAGSGFLNISIMSPEYLGGGGQELPWVDGNHVNGYNSTLNALTNNSSNPNTESSFFGFEFMTSSILLNGLAISGEFTGGISGSDMALLTNALSEDPSAWTFEIYNFADSIWNGGINTPVGVTGTDNNGWVQQGFSNMYTTLSDLGLGSATIVAVLGNTSTDLPTISFKTFSSVSNIQYDSNQLVPSQSFLNNTDYGLKAGNQYVGLIKWSPKGLCPLVDAAEVVYYFPINFWIEYCECTDETAENWGAGAGTVTPPGYNAPYWPLYMFPGVNTIAGNPENFCTGALLNGEEEAGGGVICTYDPETTITCENFLEWCLSNPVSECYSTVGGAEVIASLDVLIDGFYSAEDIDTAPYTLFIDGVDIQYNVHLYLGSTVDPTMLQYTIPSHINGVPNPEIVITNAGTIYDTALISFTELDGAIYTVAIEIVSDLVGYVVNPPCDWYTLTINLEYVGSCEELTEGCTDPTADNYDETADVEDGSCTYLECVQLFDVTAETDIQINSYTVTNTTDICVVQTDPDTQVETTILTPQNSGAFTITVHDATPIAYLGSFNVGYVKITGTAGNVIESLLSLYDNNFTTIQTGNAFVPLQDGLLGGWLPTSQNIAGEVTYEITGTELISDSGFDASSSIDNWTIAAGSTAVLTYGGSTFMRITYPTTPDSPSGSALQHDSDPLEIGVAYKVIFSARGTSGTGGAQGSKFSRIGSSIQINLASSGVTVINNPTLTTSYQTYEFDLISPSTALRVYLEQAHSNDIVDFDNFSVKAMTVINTTYTVDSMSTLPGSTLSQGTYIIFCIPFVNISALNEQGLEDCLEYIAETASDQVYLTIGTVSEECPTPCNEFSNDDDCPDAVGGCTDPESADYDPDATFDNGTCTFCTDGEYEVCDCFPTSEECVECDETAIVAGEEQRGFGAGFRECGGDETNCCCDPAACNYDPSCIWCDDLTCEYTSCDEDGDGVDDDEDTPECPDPNNPACDEDTYCVCCPDENGNLPVGCGPNEDDCIILGNCGGEDPGDPDVPDPEVPTVDFICDPQLPAITTFEGDNATWLLQQLSFMSCASEQVRKMMFRLRSGVEFDKTDLIKLSLITYLFNKGALDCIYDCNNYVEVPGKKPDMRTRDCTANWKTTGKKHFTGTSSYKKGDLVKYYYIKNGGLKFKYFYAGKDWIPGLDFPNNRTSKQNKTWLECTNVRAQSGGNPEENYFQTFYEFMIRFCTSCEVVTVKEELPPPPTKGLGSINTGIVDEDGNEIIF